MPPPPDRFRVVIGDCREQLRALERESVHCVVTSPPYWQLRKYAEGDVDPLGLEATPQEYVKRIVRIMRLVRRALRADGTCWLNLGDTYMAGRSGGIGAGSTLLGSQRNHEAMLGIPRDQTRHRRAPGLKEKDLVGIPWRVALALQADGWWLRSEVIWHKPAPMPECVRDRPTRAHEHLFLLTKSAEYWYDADAIRTPVADKTRSTYGNVRATKGGGGKDRLEPAAARISRAVPKRKAKLASDGTVLGANKRSVWSIAPYRWHGQHTSTFPPALVEPCILAGCPVGGTVLDPFCGSGTTLVKALELGRCALGIDNDPTVLEDIELRMAGTQLRLVGT